MENSNQNYPFIKGSDTKLTRFTDVIIALIPLFVPAVFFYGIRPIYIGFISVLTCVICDILCIKLRKRKVNFTDLSGVITGLIIALLMPASVPYHVPIIACIFATLIVKQPFGGFGNNIFNPAAAGFAFSAIAFTEQVFSYPAPLTALPLGANVSGFTTLTSISSTLKLGGVPKTNIMEMLLGNFAGPIGATNILVLITCLLFLLLRKTVNIKLVFSYLATIAVFTFLFPRIPGPRYLSMAYELMSSSILFGAIFIITDPVTSPKTGKGRIAFGILCSILTILFIYFGGYEIGICFAILLCNPLSAFLDKQFNNIPSSKEFFETIRKAGAKIGHKNNKAS